MQGVCDATCRFIGFACNTSGSTSDYVAFKEANISGIWPQLPAPYLYVGDCTYPLARFCLILYVGKQLPNDEIHSLGFGSGCVVLNQSRKFTVLSLEPVARI
jgi:hypothetical protein